MDLITDVIFSPHSINSSPGLRNVQSVLGRFRPRQIHHQLEVISTQHTPSPALPANTANKAVAWHLCILSTHTAIYVYKQQHQPTFYGHYTGQSVC